MFVEKYIQMSKAVIVKADKNNIILKQPGSKPESSRFIKISKLGVVSIYYSSGWFKKLEGDSWEAIDEYLIHQYLGKRCTLNPKNNESENRSILKLLNDELRYYTEGLKKNPLDYWWSRYGESNAVKAKEKLDKFIDMMNLKPIPKTKTEEIISNFTRNLCMRKLVGDKSKVSKMVKELDKGGNNDSE